MKTLNRILLMVLLLISSLNVQGEIQCGTEDIHKQMMNTDLNYKERFLSMINEIQKAKENIKIDSNARRAYVIPIVVHWVYNGDDDALKNFNINNIKNAIMFLNESFAPTGIQFCFAERDPLGNPTNGVVRWDGNKLNSLLSSFNGTIVMNDRSEYKGKCKGITSQKMKEKFIWPEKDYFNIWVVETLCVPGTEDGDFGGFGTLPWETDVVNGVVLKREAIVNFNNKSIIAIPHETGHYLGLFHTFHDEARNGQDANSDACPLESDCNIHGDMICDTPPHRSMDRCALNKPCGGLGEWNNSRYNYMNYCFEFEKDQLLFTPDQISRMMNWLMTIGSPRWTLLNSKACTPPIQALPDLTISSISVSPTTTDAGANVSLSFKVNNIGGATASPHYTSFHISSNVDTRPGNGATYLDEYYVSASLPASSSTTTITKTVKLPANLSPGTYYIFFSADGAETINESNENNNQEYVPITIRGATSTCTPSTPSGLSQSSSQTSVTLSWSQVSGAQKYEVRFNNSSYTTSSTSINIPGLNCGMSYNWQVRAVCPNGDASNYSSSRSVTTSSCGSTTQNDDCENATLIVSNGSCLNGTVRGATSSYGANRCSGCNCDPSLDDLDVYYKFVAQASSHTVTVSNYASNFDAVIELRSKCAYGSANTLGCYDPKGTPSSVSNTWNDLTVGQTYYVRVYEYNYNSTRPSRDDFTICVTHTSQSVDCDIFNYFPEVYYARSRGGSNTDESLVIHTTQPECNYRVTKGSGCDFVNIRNPTGKTTRVGSPPYIGQAEIFYDYDENNTYQQRSCILTVNGKKHTIVQNGCDPYFYPSAKSISAAGGSYTLEVDAESNCSWSFSQSNCSWVSFNRTSGSGDRDISVSVSANTSSSPRTCQITLNNGETHIINQQGVICNPPTELEIISDSWGDVVCNSNVVRLTSYTDCENCNYSWNTGEKTSSINVTKAGTYSVTVSNTCGSKSANITLTLSNLPKQPSVISGNTTICSETSQTYTIPVVADATSYQWSYSGSGSPSGTGRSITFSPTSSGILSVSAINDCGMSAVRTLAITVNPLPAQPGVITASANNICSGTNVSYSIPVVSDATSYQWSYSGGGNPSGTGRSITFSPTSSGTLSVVANNDCGSGSARTLAVTVIAIPVLSTDITGNAEVCSGTSQTYSVSTVTDATSYEWTYSGDGTLSGSGRSIKLSPTISGTLKVVAKNSCGNSSAKTLAIKVSNSSVTTPKDISGNTVVCSGSAQTYSVPAVSGATSYEWTYSGGGNISGIGRSITFSPTSNGTLSVKAKNGCSTSTAKTLSIKVNPLPARPGVITASANNVCSGTSISYSIAAVSGATSYTWSYSGGGSPSGKGTSVSFKPTSSGTLSVVANNDCGAGTERTFAVTVKTVPDKPAISANGNIPFVQMKV
ncbi:MAG: M43 family zinc metalloprotease [Chitinophagales bacterium]|nr:M43 family zinc metalloprotease [Chitinophagales bacterium]